MSTIQLERTKVFISYSHKDSRWLERLQVHLKPLEREGMIECWSDTRIVPGLLWQDKIRQALVTTKVAVLLISADFLASDFIFNNELPHLLTAAKTEGVIILPVIVSPCRFERTPLKEFQVVNPSRPLNSLTEAGQEEILKEIVGIIEDKLSIRNSSESSESQRTGLIAPRLYEPAQPFKKVRILFLAANPLGTNRLALDKEAREIEAKIRAAEHREALELITKWAVRADDILQALNQYRPDIVHFSGHGSKIGQIILTDDKDQPKPISKEALSSLFHTLKDNIRVVVLNTCFSRPQAEAIAKHIDYTIGTNAAIEDKEAILFAASFYRAIGFGRSVQEAFDQGVTALLLDGTLSEKIKPALLIRADRNEETYIPELPRVIPELSGPPKKSYMQKIRTYFVGRESYLKDIADTLNETYKSKAVQVVALTGLGGIGKTALAVEFVWRYGQYFKGGVFWINFAADQQSIETEIAKCGGPGALGLGPPDFSNLPQKDQVDLVRAEWEDLSPRLLIFDSCEDEDLLEKYQPRVGGSRVIVTSRRHEWKNAKVLDLRELDTRDSIDLLHEFRPDAIEGELNGIATQLGNLPLALELAGNHLKKYRYILTPNQYLNELTDLQSSGSLNRLIEHPAFEDAVGAKSLASAFALSYNKLDIKNSLDKLAQKLLINAAYFVPGIPILRKLLLGTLKLKEERNSEDLLNRLEYDLGLLRREKNKNKTFFVLHRLLAAFVQAKAKEVNQDIAAATIVEKTVLEWAERQNRTGNPTPLTDWETHLAGVAEAAKNRNSEYAGALYNQLGYHLRQLAKYDQAIETHKKALEISRGCGLRLMSVDTSDDLVNEGRNLIIVALVGTNLHIRIFDPNGKRVVDKAENKLTSGEKLMTLKKQLKSLSEESGLSPEQKQKTIRDAALITGYSLSRSNKEFEDEIDALINLGNDYAEQGKNDPALVFYSQALTVAQEIGDTIREGRALDHLGTNYRILGELSRAINYHEQALEITIKNQDSREKAYTLGHLCTAYRDLGKAEIDLGSDIKSPVNIIKLYEEEVLQLARDIGDHRWQGYAYDHIGIVYRDQGKADLAIKYHEKAIELAKNNEDLRGIAYATAHLSTAHWDKGEYLLARKYCRKALSIARKVRDGRLETYALGHFGTICRDKGHPRFAIKFYERARVIAADERKDKRGEAYALGHLGTAWADLGKSQYAISEYYEKALSIAHEIGDQRGESHVLASLGTAYRNLGQPSHAIFYYEQALGIADQIHHPHLMIYILSHLGTAYRDRAKHSRAIDYYKEAIDLADEIGDDRMKSYALSHRGTVYREQGDIVKAIADYEQALKIENEIRIPRVKGYILAHIGTARTELDEFQNAISNYHEKTKSIHMGIAPAEPDEFQNIINNYYKKAKNIAHKIGDRRVERYVLTHMGRIYQQLGNYKIAIEHYEEALRIASNLKAEDCESSSIGDRRGESYILIHLGTAYQARDDYKEAEKHYKKALDIAREIGDLRGQENVLHNFGALYHKQDKRSDAIAFYAQELAITRERNNRQGQCDVLYEIGTVYQDMREYGRANNYYKQSLDIAHEIKDNRREEKIISKINGL